MCLAAILLAGSAWGQPYFFSGTVKTPTGQPIADAQVWYAYYGSGPLAGTGASCESSGTGTYGDAASGYLPFNGGYYDIWLRISKPGYDFRPLSVISGSPTEYPGYYWTKSQGPYSNTVRNFTGVPVAPVTSGMTASASGSPGGWSYFSTDVPAGATELQFDYKGTGDSTIQAKPGDWPTGTLSARAPKPAGTPTTRSVVINASSTPAIQAGKWYLGVYSLEQTTFTLKTTMRSADPLPVISGRVTRFDGVSTTPLAGLVVKGTNGATSATTNGSGDYQVTVPFNWSGEISVYYPTGRFLPTSRSLGAVASNQTNQNFSGPQYYLTVNSPFGNPVGAGWYDSGTTASWSVTNPFAGGAGIRYLTATPSGSVPMSGPKSVTVSWKTQYLLSPSVNKAQTGWISPSSSGWYNPGAIASVNAWPASGYKFVDFSGDLSGSVTPQNVTMNGPKTVTANFAPLVTPTPTPTPTPVAGRIQVPFEKKTIQQAIDAAQSGNEVVVYPGSYRENIRINGKNITVRSTAPNDPKIVAATIIDGTTTALAATVTFAGAEPSTCTLSGFTITNGRGLYGGGISGNNTRATITYNVITKNHAVYNYTDFSGEGGGINRCNGVIRDCTITSNTSESWGAGIAECNGTIDRCSIAFNSTGPNINAGGFYKCDDAVISNCLIYENTGAIGGGMFFEDHGAVTNCTIAQNHATSDWASWGGGIYCYYAKVTLKNSIVWGNTGIKLQAGNPIYWYQYMAPSTSYVSNTCIQDWGVTDNGCTSADPEFIDAAKYNFQLVWDSPCVDTGTTVGLTSDIRGMARPFGLGFDMGAYEYVSMPAPEQPAISILPTLTMGTEQSVSWSAAARAAKYIAQMAQSEDFTSPLQEIQADGAGWIVSSVKFTGLSDGKYYYRVCGENAIGVRGPWSPVVSSTQDATAPWFSNVAAQPSQAYAGVSVKITFTASEALAADPVVTVNGRAATRAGKVNNNYTFNYITQAAETVGAAAISISGSDMVGYPCAITNTTALTFLTNPVGISGLTPSGCSTDVLNVGKRVYGDRTYTFVSPMISTLQYQTYIKTSNADKDSTSLKVQFTVSQPVVIFVGLAENIAAPPAWMNGWYKRGDKLTTNDGTAGRMLYEKRFPAGKITLGANRDSTMPTGKSMYTVVIVPTRNGVADWSLYR